MAIHQTFSYVVQEWPAGKNGSAWKEQLKAASTYDACIELILRDSAKNMLKRFGINPKNIDVEKLRSDYNALYSKKQTLQKTYKSAEKETANLNRKLANLNQYLDRNSEQPTADKK